MVKAKPSELEKDMMYKAIHATIKEQILGIFGDDDSNTCLHRMHGMLEFADKLGISGIKITVTQKELMKALNEYMNIDDNDDPRAIEVRED